MVQSSGTAEKTFSNISAVALINSFEGEKGEVTAEGGQSKISTEGMTNEIAGIAINVTGTNIEFDNVDMSISVNKNVDQSKQYGVNMYGGLFVRTNAEAVAQVIDVTINMDFYSNYSADYLLNEAKYNAGIAEDAASIDTTGLTVSGKIARGESVSEVA